MCTRWGLMALVVALGCDVTVPPPEEFARHDAVLGDGGGLGDSQGDAAGTDGADTPTGDVPDSALSKDGQQVDVPQTDGPIGDGGTPDGGGTGVDGAAATDAAGDAPVADGDAAGTDTAAADADAAGTDTAVVDADAAGTDAAVADADAAGTDTAVADADAAGTDTAVADADAAGTDAAGTDATDAGQGLCPWRKCSDGNPCTDDDCDPKVGCVFKPNTLPCEDGNACTKGDSCKDKGCKAGAIVTCDDGNVCTTDSCDLVDGCKAVPNSALCGGTDACTGTGVCKGGTCSLSGTGCDDKNPCTADSCGPKATCQHLAKAGPCDDGLVCTLGDACADGVCGGYPDKCDDGQPCTDDGCNPLLGCQHTPNASVCVDGNICTMADKCKDGTCQSSKMVDCDDGNACTKDACDPKTGCTHGHLVSKCDDGDLCTTMDECKDGTCKGEVLKAKDCDDGQVCSTDSCDPKLGCVHAPNSGLCNDGDACTILDACVEGKCVGQPNLCDDGNVCTNDACVATKGCNHTPNTASCDDQDPCTETDVCKGGKCVGVLAKVDADGDKVADKACGGKDCDDTDPTVYPGAPELCDGKPNDCDNPGAFEPCTDLDGDGFCAAGDKVIGKPTVCPSGGGDCSDGNPYAYPGAPLECLDPASPEGRIGEGPCDFMALSATWHMAWRGSVFEDMRYSLRKSGSLVQTTVVDRAIGLGPPALVADTKGAVHIAYTNSAKNAVHLSTLVGAGFKRLALAPAKPGHVGVALDSKGAVHVTYTGQDGTLYEAVASGNQVMGTSPVGALTLEPGRSLLSAPGDVLVGTGRGADGAVVVTRKSGGKWSVETLNAATTPGAGMSIAISPSSARYVCFQEALSHQLKLAYEVGTKWTILDVPGSGHYGANCGVIVNAQFHVELVYEHAGTGKVLHSRWDGAQWTSAPIAGLARQHLCGLSGIGASGLALGRAGRTQAEWTASKWVVTSDFKPQTCGGAASLAVGADGKHHLTAWTHPSVCHATDAGGAWSVEKIAGVGVQPPVSAPAIAVGASGQPLLAWSTVVGEAAVLQVVRPAPGGWKPETALSWPGGGDGFGYPGPHLSVAKDGTEHLVVLPHISSTLRHAWRTASGWKTESTAAKGISQSWADRVSFAVGDAPHVLYCTPAGELRHATRSASGVWSTGVVEQQGCAWLSLSGVHGKQVTVIYSTGSAIRYALYDGVAWSAGGQTPPELPPAGAAVSSVVTKDGLVRAAYRTPAAVYLSEGKLGGPFVSYPILTGACQFPTLQLAPGEKIALACGLDLFARQP